MIGILLTVLLAALVYLILAALTIVDRRHRRRDPGAARRDPSGGFGFGSRWSGAAAPCRPRTRRRTGPGADATEPAAATLARAGGRTRTAGLRFTRALLYQLSYSGVRPSLGAEASVAPAAACSMLPWPLEDTGTCSSGSNSVLGVQAPLELAEHQRRRAGGARRPARTRAGCRRAARARRAPGGGGRPARRAARARGARPARRPRRAASGGPGMNGRSSAYTAPNAAPFAMWIASPAAGQPVPRVTSLPSSSTSS